jgi:hypothetical protein
MSTCLVRTHAKIHALNLHILSFALEIKQTAKYVAGRSAMYQGDEA